MLQSTDFREAQIAEIDIKPNKALLDQMISAEKKSKEQVKLTTKQSPAKSRDAVDLRLVKTEQESALTESRATDLESTPPRKNGKGIDCKLLPLRITNYVKWNQELNCQVQFKN